MSAREEPDVRRFVAARAYGVTRMVLMVQETVVALRRAVEHGELVVAGALARRLLLECCSIRSAATRGELTWSTDEITHDPFRGLDAVELAQCRELLTDAAGLTPATAGSWSARVETFVNQTEQGLDYGEPLPQILSPEGLYPALGVARRVGQVIDEFRLPPLPFPDSWTRRSGS